MLLYLFIMCRYLIGNTLGFTVSLCLILEESADIWFWIITCTAIIWTCLIDAMPAHIRKLSAIVGPGSGVIFLVVLMLGLFFKKIPINDFHFFIGFIRVDMSSLVISFLFNTMIFLMRYLWTAIRNPGEMVVLTSPVVSVKVNKVVSVFFSIILICMVYI